MGNIHFGADYYPEHWPEERWETDARLMREMGIDVVRVAEFAWQKMEPREGQFDFSWLDRSLAILGDQGIKAVVGTPTAAPPAWIIERNPEILPVDSHGLRRSFGGRHHDCQSNAVYRAHARRIVEAMAKHFKSTPNVVGWQIDNELGNSHDDFCHCDSCRAAFQDWLRKKYVTIAELNKRWGTAFWSQGYDDFQQIPTPAATPVSTHSPSLLLDWKRFHSELIVDFAEAQEKIIRAIDPERFITHNCMGFCDLIDYFKLAEGLDFVSHDQYPMGFFDQPQPMKDSATLAAHLDLMAGLKRKSFWIMEQQAGPTGWTIMGRTPRPGQLALWAAQSIAHGADAVVYFRWRSCTVGTEQYWHGILPHNGVPGRRYAELKELATALGPAMDEMRGSLAEAEAAILFSYDQSWALAIQPHHPELEYRASLLRYYKAFHDANIPVAFTSGTEDLSKYKLLLAPLQFLDFPELRERLIAYARSGGHLVLTMRSGVKDAENVCLADAPLPGPYGETLGIEILDYDCLRDVDQAIACDGGVYSGKLWWDVVTLKGARALASGSRGDHSGEPIVTVAETGKGAAYYVGTEPDPELAAKLVDLFAKDAGVASLGPSPAGVELARRRTPDADYLFALNHSGEERVLSQSAEWRPLVGSSRLGPYSFCLFKAKRG
jgi:Beta-galactosidase